jgi:hypothetical protein
MAKPRPEKKIPEKKEPSELPDLPMNLQVGDRIVDERGEWRVVGRPYTTAAGKTARVSSRARRTPRIHEIRVWSAHERVAVKRAER